MDEAQEKKLLSFLETATFVERLAELGGDQQMELLYAIQDELLADPERGDLVKGLGGVRKARIAAPTRPEGKRGGYRYLYLYLEMRGRIYLLYLFDKREQSDLDDEEHKVLASIVDRLKRAGKKGKS
jgi:hypothetical protein